MNIEFDHHYAKHTCRDIMHLQIKTKVVAIIIIIVYFTNVL